MDCTNRMNQRKLRILIMVLLPVLVFVWIAVIVFVNNKPDSAKSPRIEDMLFFTTISPVTSTAFTPEYKLSAVQYFSENDNGWFPEAYQLVLTDIKTSGEKRMDIFDAWFVYVLSDGEKFYLFVDAYDEDPLGGSGAHQIYSFDTKTEILEHLITYGPITDDEGEFPSDIVANGKLFYFINRHSIQVFDPEKKTCEDLYTTKKTLSNDFIHNRAKLYKDKLLVAVDDDELFMVDVLTGEATRMLSFVGMYIRGTVPLIYDSSIGNTYKSSAHSFALWATSVPHSPTTSIPMETW